MPRSMGSPNYVYTPWTPERRAAASEAGKARWRAKREAESADWKRTVEATSEITRRIREQRDLQDRAAKAYYRYKNAADALEKVRGLLTEASDLLKPFGLQISATDLSPPPTVGKTG